MIFESSFEISEVNRKWWKYLLPKQLNAITWNYGDPKVFQWLCFVWHYNKQNPNIILRWFWLEKIPNWVNKIVRPRFRIKSIGHFILSSDYSFRLGFWFSSGHNYPWNCFLIIDLGFWSIQYWWRNKNYPCLPDSHGGADYMDDDWCDSLPIS